MRTVSVPQRDIFIPDPAEVAAVYPACTPYLSGPNRELYDAVMQPEIFLRAAAITDVYGAPAVAAAVAATQAVADARGTPLTNAEKQCVGALMAMLMEPNGFVKVPGLRKRVGLAPYTKGQVFKRR